MEPADWSALADDHVLRAQMRERLISALTHAAGGLSRAGDPARHPGTVDRRGERSARVKPQTLKSRLHRGRLMLREHLADFAGGIALHARDSVN